MSVLNIPGNVLRGAADFVPTVRRPNLRGLLNNDADWKATLQVKGTPTKDAETMSQFAVRKGYLRKKNEQGQFHWRYACTVPHMFLYYYDSDHAQSPRGIIDLELFTKIDIEGDENNILKLAVDDDSAQMRAFYFEMDNANELSDWITSILRDRYLVVKEERDAYRNLSDQFSGEMDTATKQKAVSTHDMGKLQVDISTCKQNFILLFDTVKGVLDVIGVFDDEGQILEEKRDSVDETYQAKSVQWVKDSLTSAVVNLKERLEKTNRLEKEESSRQMKDMTDRITVLELQLSREKAAVQKLQKECDEDKIRSEIRLRQACAQIDQSSLNLQAAIATKCVVEENAKKLYDQKKVLVKEVKQLRSKVEELTFGQGELMARLLADPVQTPSIPLARSSSSLVVTRVQDSNDDDIEDKEPPPGSLAWLDPAQRIKLQHTHLSHVPRSDTFSMVKRFGISVQPDDDNATDGRDIVIDAVPESEDNSVSQSVSHSLSLLGNVFQISSNESPPKVTPLLSVHNDRDEEEENIQTDSVAGSGGGVSSVTLASAAGGVAPGVISSPSYTPAPLSPAASAFVLTCLRCQGTVEGPKNSSCKCAEPALTPDQLQLNDSSFNSDAAASSVSNAWKSVAARGRRFSMMRSAFSSSTASSSGGNEAALPSTSVSSSASS